MSRKCGALEVYSVGRNELKLSSVVVVAGTYNHPLARNVLYPALRALISKEPLLSWQVYGSTLDKGGPEFRPLKSVNLDNVVAFSPELDFQTLQAQQIPAVILPYNDDSVPLWRLHVIGTEQNEAAFVFDHSAFDGNSGALFHKKLLACLNQVDGQNEGGTADGEDAIVSVPQHAGSDSVFKSLESLRNIKPPLPFFLKVILSIFKSKLVPSKKWTGPHANATPHCTQLVFYLDADKSAALAAAAKAKSVTVTSLVYELFARALVSGELVPPSIAAKSSIKYESALPVNARRYLSDDGSYLDKLGNYVFQYSDHNLQRLAIGSKKAGAAAQSFNRDLKTNLAKPKSLGYVIGLLQYINIRDYLEGEIKPGHQRSYTTEFSSLGQFNFEPASANGPKWTITNLGFSQGVSAMGAPFILNLVSVRGCSSTFAIAAAYGGQEGKDVCEKIRESLLAQIMTAIEGSSA